jgi:septal ring factor EnvC (AmiA/AmiB activator)
MAEKKINDDRLLQLIRDGNSSAEAARKLGVGRAAVCKCLKRLRVGISKDVALRSAAKVVDRGMDAIAQLQKINNSINAELDHIEENANGLSGQERERYQEQRLKHVSEIRKQLGLMTDIYQLYANYEEAKAFKQALFQALRECAPQAIPAFRQKLREMHAIRSDLDLEIEG